MVEWWLARFENGAAKEVRRLGAKGTRACSGCCFWQQGTCNSRLATRVVDGRGVWVDDMKRWRGEKG
ncbi:hypothetical protein GOBAR_AA29099 [Gossypium barbadense]|uniref:Uncharacterized protein n=1 Tax=Gossypium barbadense TaxID=3634 RepID=A0A2P5WKI5_GOSBA|nr:hypothetical protein GOBAR_AA29099 [Gossypium barbadense]